MIVEKRKRLRKPYLNDLDWDVEVNFDEPVEWEEEPVAEITPAPVIMLFALLTAVSAYAIGSFLFSSLS